MGYTITVVRDRLVPAAGGFFFAFPGYTGTIFLCQNTYPERFYQGNSEEISRNVVFF